jgi:hypothetical protein
VARSRASAIVRPAHGLHPVWHRRCRCHTELAGATGAAERGWHCATAMSAERPGEHGFTNAMLDALVRNGLAMAEQRAMRAGGRRSRLSAWRSLMPGGRRLPVIAGAPATPKWAQASPCSCRRIAET